MTSLYIKVVSCLLVPSSTPHATHFIPHFIASNVNTQDPLFLSILRQSGLLPTQRNQAFLSIQEDRLFFFSLRHRSPASLPIYSLVPCMSRLPKLHVPPCGSQLPMNFSISSFSSSFSAEDSKEYHQSLSSFHTKNTHIQAFLKQTQARRSLRSLHHHRRLKVRLEINCFSFLLPCHFLPRGSPRILSILKFLLTHSRVSLISLSRALNWSHPRRPRQPL